MESIRDIEMEVDKLTQKDILPMRSEAETKTV